MDKEIKKVIIKKEYYRLDGVDYNSLEEAEEAANLKRYNEYSYYLKALATEFEIKEYHLQLFWHININFRFDSIYDSYTYQSSYRPYGNSDVFGDLQEYTDLVPHKEEGDYTKDECFILWKAHRDMAVCLQILFDTQKLELGIYKRKDCGERWVKV